MADMGRWQPAADEPVHSLPQNATMLASSAQRAMPEVAHGETKVGHGMTVTRYSEITKMPAHNGLQPLTDFRNRVMHASPQLDLHLLQLGLHAFANRLPKHQKPSVLRLPANMLEAEKVGFVNRVEHFHRRSLNKLVFERRDAERSLPPIRLRNVDSTHRLRPVRSALQSMGEVLEILLKVLAVVLPRLSVNTGRRMPLQLEVSKPQSVDPVDVMQQSGELHILVQCCRLSYLFQLTRRV